MSRDGRIRVLSVLGTRPEAIKMAPVLRLLAADGRFDSRVCVTGQHRRMLDQVLRLFQVVPDHDLNLMAPGQDLFDITSRVLLGLRPVLELELPDVVLVHGDTTTCLAAALAAFYKGVPVAHVEAGLRSGDLARPFPEEANRVLVDRLSRIHFAPTESARAHLLAEGTDPARIHVVGNTVVDALLEVKAEVEDLSAWSWRAALGARLCTRLEARRERVVLVTGHRRESFGRGFQDLCRAIRSAAQAHRDWLFVYPVHLNPNVQGPVHSILAGVDNVVLIEPLEYAPCVWLMLRSDAILTDSGGMQEEGSALGKPLLVMREVTERPEAVTGGGARLVGTDPARILAGLEAVVGNGELASALASRACPYGDGRTAARIVDVLLREVQPSSLELLAVA